MSLKPIDSFASYRLVEMKLDGAVKRGEVDREKAHKILKDAKENYRDNRYNKLLERRNKHEGKD
jgi:hypothetical protein